MKPHWTVLPEAPREFTAALPEYPDLLLQLLYHRGITERKDIERFMDPRYEDLHDPFLLPDMRKAVRRILTAVRQREDICVIGDYDADGVSGATVLVSVLRQLNAEPFVYIPDRNKEGYGLNAESIAYAREKHAKLVITVDCGISDYDEVEQLRALGIDTIIVDHHEVPPKPPRAYAKVNPCMPESAYPFPELSAAGVAFKLATALLQEDGAQTAGQEKWLLDVVALSTVADVMPMTDENRVLVKYGLVVMGKTRRKGLRELITRLKLDPQHLTAYHLGYILGPHINAASRIDHANQSFRLLNTASLTEAQELADTLMGLNKKRQAMVDEMMREVVVGMPKPVPYLLFAGSKKWNAGVLGLVAGKVKEKYQRPTVLYSDQGSTSKASARSVEGFDIVEAFAHCAEYLDQFGGHPMAGGFSFDARNAAAVQQCLQNYAEGALRGKDLTPIVRIDATLALQDVLVENIEEVSKLEPFGRDNAEPVFVVRNATILEARTMGKSEQHMKLKLEQDGAKTEAIAFNYAQIGAAPRAGDRVDLVATLSLNEWGNMRRAELKVIDLHIIAEQ